MQPKESFQVQLFDSGGSNRGMEHFGPPHRVKKHRKAELHKFYLKVLELCKKCACPPNEQPPYTCPSYADLWQELRCQHPQAHALTNIPNADVRELLAAWHA